MIGVYLGCNRAVVDNAGGDLTILSNQNSLRTLSGASAWLRNLFSASQNGFVDPVALAAVDTYNRTYSVLPPLPAYMDYNASTLAQPLTQDSRQAKPVSLSRSSYYVPGKFPVHIPTFSVALNNSIALSTFLDTFWRVVYTQYSQIVAGYIAFDNQGLFIKYPGTWSLDSDPLHSYNPTVRPWFQLARGSVGSAAIVTPPYLDYYNRGWMLTFAVNVRLPNSTNLGVAGADLLLSQLQNRISGLSLLDSGKVSMFDVAGNVVADREWVDMTKGLTYKELQRPPLSDSLFSTLKAFPTTPIVDATSGYTLSVSAITPQFFLVSYVKQSEVSAPVRALENAIGHQNLVFCLAFFGFFVVLVVALFIQIVLVVRDITKPLQQIDANIAVLTGCLGGDRLMLKKLSPITCKFGAELFVLADAFNQIVAMLQNAAAMRLMPPLPNPLFRSARISPDSLPGMANAPLFFQMKGDNVEPSAPPVRRNVAASRLRDDDVEIEMTEIT